MKNYKEFVDEALSRRDALKMAAAKAAFFKGGGKIEKQPPSPSVGSHKYRGQFVKSPTSKEDEKRAKAIAKFRKTKGYDKPTYKLTKGKKVGHGKEGGYMGLPYGYDPYSKHLDVKK